MKRFTSVIAALLLVVSGASSVRAAVSYWDTNGTDPGTVFSGFADGIWGTDPFWTADPAGLTATGAWTAGNDAVFSAGTDGVGVEGIVTITGTQTANSITIEEGYIKFRGGTADAGANAITINAGATLDIDNTARLNTGAGKVVLNGGTLRQAAGSSGGSFIGTGANTTTGDGGGLKALEINGIGYIGYDDGDGVADNKVTIFSGVINGTGGTTTNGGAGTLVKIGPDQIGIGVSDQDFTAGAPRIHSQDLFTFAKLVVKQGGYRLRNGTQDGTVRETAFGAVPLSVLADAITLDGGGIGSNTNVTLHANRGITVTANGGYLDHGAGAGLSIPGPITGAGTLSIGDATSATNPAPNPTFTISNAGNATTFTGKINVLRSTLTVPSAAALGATPASFVADSITIGGTAVSTTGTSQLNFSGSTTLGANRGITLAGVTDGRINIASGGNTLTYDGVISGPGKFIKMGDGAMVTAGAHTYTGGTDVYGKLIVNNTSGSGTGTGAVAVKTAGTLGTNGTLGGTGSVSGLVTVESGAALAPGAATGAVGTLGLAGGLTLSAGSILNFDLGAPSTGDKLNVGGTTTISGGTLNITNAGGLATGTYTLLDYAGALGGSFANLVLGTQPAGFTFNLVNNAGNTSIDLSVTSAVVGVQGDYNNNGVVDAADYVLWRNGGPLQNEVATIGSVTPEDYTEWRARFGNITGSGSSLGGAAVPEPAALGLLVLSLAGIVAGRRSR